MLELHLVRSEFRLWRARGRLLFDLLIVRERSVATIYISMSIQEACGKVPEQVTELVERCRKQGSCRLIGCVSRRRGVRSCAKCKASAPARRQNHAQHTGGREVLCPAELLRQIERLLVGQILLELRDVIRLLWQDVCPERLSMAVSIAIYREI